MSTDEFEAMLANCWYVDIRVPDLEIYLAIKEAVQPLMENAKLKLWITGCGKFEWMDIEPFVIIRDKFTKQYRVYEARKMKSEEMQQAVQGIIR